MMDDRDLELRNLTYRLLVELGRPPLAHELELPVADVQAGWQRLHDAHALVLDHPGQEILMANPFSAVPTPHRVEAGGRWWFGNCAWDAFGICAALASDGRIESECPDCSGPVAVDVRDGWPSDRTLLFHCLVPAAHWWDDIVFT
jgi:Alkylmercury lyase